jgi:hypothetical protein
MRLCQFVRRAGLLGGRRRVAGCRGPGWGERHHVPGGGIAEIRLTDLIFFRSIGGYLLMRCQGTDQGWNRWNDSTPAANLAPSLIQPIAG